MDDIVSITNDGIKTIKLNLSAVQTKGESLLSGKHGEYMAFYYCVIQYPTSCWHSAALCIDTGSSVRVPVFSSCLYLKKTEV